MLDSALMYNYRGKLSFFSSSKKLVRALSKQRSCKEGRKGGVDGKKSSEVNAMMVFNNHLSNVIRCPRDDNWIKHYEESRRYL